MPGVTLHLVLAELVLEEWKRTPGSAPFNPLDTHCALAFRHGALGPDLGYFPGGPRMVSDLAHRVRSADLTRALVAAARTPTQRAFAWGWVTHVVADGDIHPLVGRGVGELLLGDSDTFVDGMTCPAEHVRVETGIDVLVRTRLGPGFRPRLDAVFDRFSLEFLAEAYGRTYGVVLDPARLSDAHAGAARLAAGAVGLVSFLSRGESRSGPSSCIRRGARRCLVRARERFSDPDGVATLPLAFLTPVAPSRWLVRGVYQRAATFAERIRTLRSAGLESLENRDLDTGVREVPGVPTPTAEGVLEQLRRVPLYPTVPVPQPAPFPKPVPVPVPRPAPVLASVPASVSFPALTPPPSPRLPTPVEAA